jgi:hypothetical protein
MEASSDNTGEAWKLLPLVSFLEQSQHDEWQVQLRCTLATATLAERWSELLAVARHEAALFVGMSLQYWRSQRPVLSRRRPDWWVSLGREHAVYDIWSVAVLKRAWYRKRSRGATLVPPCRQTLEASTWVWVRSIDCRTATHAKGHGQDQSETARLFRGDPVEGRSCLVGR